MQTLTNDPFVLLNLFGGLACLPALLYVVYQRFFSPLAGIPGPFWASLSRLWYAYIVWKGNMHQVLPGLHRKYGDVVRIAPNEVQVQVL